LLACTFACACTPVGNDTDGPESETDTTTTTGGDIPAPCEAYLACRDEATPSSAADAHAEYGEDGTCWEQQSESACIEECQTQFTQYGMSYPDLDACAPPPSDVVLKIGAADFEDGNPFATPTFRPLADGGTLNLLRGGQGLLMLPMGLRGENFEVPEDPIDFTNPKMPILDLWLDIEGYNIGVGGHFSRIANYPIGFLPINGGALEHLYTAILVPDEFDASTINDLDGLPGHLWIELRTFDNPPTIREIDVVISVEEDSG